MPPDFARLYSLGPEVSLDIETDGIRALECAILCVGISDGQRTIVIHPWRDSYSAELARFLRTRAKVIAHNGFNFDQIVLQARGLDLSGIRWDDTLIAHHTFASHVAQRLDWVVSTYCDAAPWKIKHGRRGGAQAEKGSAVADLPISDLLKYNAADCQLTARSWQRMQGDLCNEAHVYEHDLKLAAICRDMGVSGIFVDRQRKEELSNALLERGAELLAEMRKLVGAEFSPARPAHVRNAFRGLGAPIISRTDSGLMSVDDMALEMYSISANKPLAAMANLLGEWRVSAKIRSTYVGGAGEVRLKFDDFIDPSTGRAHFNWKLFGTVSGRLACRFQSYPRWSAAAPHSRAREIFIPAPGMRFVYFDVSQAEMRLAAHLSADPAFMAACGSDVHAGNARAVFPEAAAKGWLEGDALKDPERGKKFRDISKNFGFAVGYGAGADKLYTTLRSKGFAVTVPGVRKILEKLRATYHVYYKWAEANVTECKRVGYMRTPFLGRIRHMGRFPNPTEIFNFPIQGGLADIMNARTIILTDALADLGARPIVQVHDALVFETPARHVDEAKARIAAEWAKPLKTLGGELVLPIDLKVGGRLSEL